MPRLFGAAALCCVVVLLAVMYGRPGGSIPRDVELAYDGPYDTPPVTWYFPAQESQVRLHYLGMCWKQQ